MISKSLLNEVGILENLAKQENFVSNSLGNKVGIFSKLAFFRSARASFRARIRLRIAGAGLPARSRKLRRLFPAPSLRPAASLVAFFFVAATVQFHRQGRRLPSRSIPSLSSPRPPGQVRSSSSILFFPWPLFLRWARSRRSPRRRRLLPRRRVSLAPGAPPADGRALAVPRCSALAALPSSQALHLHTAHLDSNLRDAPLLSR